MNEPVSERLRDVRDTIARACAAAGRSAEEVTLIAVSKRHGEQAIREAYAAGQRDFGENYVQELVDKAGALSDLPDLRWHFVGHLQRNKVPQLLDVPCTLHTLDSTRLADTLQRRLESQGRRLDVLVQANLAGEAQKAGVPVGELSALVAHVAECDCLRLRGLMVIPPEHADPEASREEFRRLAELAQLHRVRDLSMGMSQDLSVAVQQGATMVRVGTAIFGARI